jgi:hypothetical protein
MVRSSIQSSAVNRSTVSLTDLELRLIGQAVLEHLRQESAYLDSVIACSLKMSELLKHSSYADQLTVDAANSGNRPAEPSPMEQLKQMRDDLVNEFAPIAEGRDVLNSTMLKLKSETEDPPSLRQLASELDGPVKDELMQLRSQIRDKLQDVQTITLGNQAVLIYTLDFYHRLMMGITGESPVAPSYNSHGQRTQSIPTHLVEKQC